MGFEFSNSFADPTILQTMVLALTRPAATVRIRNFSHRNRTHQVRAGIARSTLLELPGHGFLVLA
jgi:hypothetical protein